MDALEMMTKAEIIEWIRGQSFFNRHLPQKSNVLWGRWSKKVNELQKRREEHIKHGESLDLKKRDEYAKQFNATQDINKRMLLIEKMKPYEKKLKAYIEESNAIMREDEKHDKLYKRMEMERAKEQALKAEGPLEI